MSTVRLLDGRLEGVDVSASGSTKWFPIGDGMAGGLSAAGTLKTLVGGTAPTITVQMEHSPDGVLGFDLGSPWTAWTAPADKEAQHETGPVFAFARFTWATTGAPISATADLFVQAAGA